MASEDAIGTLIKTEDLTSLVDFWGKATSYVWQYFGFHTRDGYIMRDKVICKLCFMAYKYTGNTTNLANHLRRHHPDIPEPSRTNNRTVSQLKRAVAMSPASESPGDEDNALAMGTAATPTPGPSQIRTVSANIGHIHQQLVNYVIQEMLPWSSVASSSFRDFLRTLNPTYEVPSEDIFLNTFVPPLKEEVQYHLSTKISGPHLSTLCLELWSSTIGVEYVTVTAHLLTPQWKPIDFCLHTKPLTGDQSEKVSYLVVLLQQVLDEWHWPKPKVIITDGSECLVEAVEQFGSVNLPCLQSTFNLAVKKALELEEVKGVLTGFLQLVACCVVRRSELINRLHRALSVDKHELPKDMPQGWMEICSLMMHMLKYPSALDAIHHYLTFDEPKTSIQWSHKDAQSLQKALEPLKMAVNVLVEQTPASASLIMPIMAKLKRELDVKSDDDSITTQMKTTILQVLVQSYSNLQIQEFLTVATYLDPRFKQLYFLPQSSRQDATKLLMSAANDTAQSRKPRLPPSDFLIEATDTEEPDTKQPEISVINVEPDSTSSILTSAAAASNSSIDSSNAQDTGSRKRKYEANDWLEDIVSETPDVKITQTTVPIQDLIQREVDRFIIESPTKALPYSWWEQRSNTFPLLTPVANHYLGVPATGCPKDWLQGDGGEAYRRKRSQLPAYVVDTMVYLHQNIGTKLPGTTQPDLSS